MSAKTIIRLIPRSKHYVKAVLAMRNQDCLPTRKHLEMCGEWLLHSQTLTDNDGYLASYSLISASRNAYIETTGYIVPTMFDLAETLQDSRYRKSALLAGEWLLLVQKPDGSFTDSDEYKPQVFDTGQVMLGLNRLYRETGDNRYLEATRRAAEWLVHVQDEDGSWTSAAYYPGKPATYHSRVAAAILESVQLTGDSRHQEGAVKCLRWVVSQQQENGFFQNNTLHLGADPVLHTMVYVLEGFLMAYQLTGQQEWLDVLLRGAIPLLKVQLERDLVPRSQYNHQWQVTNAEKCIPGLAQWACVCLALYEITKDGDWLNAARGSIYYLKSKQIQGKGVLNGALPGSVPLWGSYQPLMFPNWAVKFFADALLGYKKYDFAVWQEQEFWVRRCHELQLDGGGWHAQSTKLKPLDAIICDGIRVALANLGQNLGRVLDLGCGEGRYLEHLQAQLSNWEFVGVDPGVAEDEGKIRNGSAYQIPFPDNYFDAAYTFAVLQHIDDLPRALGELRRVLKPGGILVIGDRDLISSRGLLKPLHELRGRWIYPWDSPFRERWYSAWQWKRQLAQSGFKVTYCERLLNPGDRGWRRLAWMNGFLLLSARK